MRLFLTALLLLSITTLTLGQEPTEPLGKPILAIDHPGHEANIADYAFTPDGKKLVTIGVDNTVQFWDAVTREHLKTIRLPWKPGTKGTDVGFIQNDSKLTVAADGKTLAMLLSNKPGIGVGGFELFLVSLETGRMIRLPGLGNGKVERLTFSRDGDSLAAGVQQGAGKAQTGKVYLWRGLRKVNEPDAAVPAVWKEWNYKDGIADIAFAPDGSKLAVAVSLPSGDFKIHNLKEPDATPRTIDLDEKNKKDRLHAKNLAWSPGGTRLATEVHDGPEAKGLPTRLMILSSEGQVVKTVQTDLSAPPVFVDENELLLFRVLQRDKDKSHWKAVIVSRFDVQKNRQDEVVRCVIPDTRKEVNRFRVASDYKRLVLGDRGDDIALLELEANATLTPFAATQPRPRFALSKMGHKIAWTANNGTQLIAGIDLKTVEPLSSDELKADNFGPPGKPEVNKRGVVEVKMWGVTYTVFAAGQEWVAMTPQGYYAASPGGEKLVGWHVNNGYDKLANFYSFDRFRTKLYRPDVLSRIHQTDGNLAKALQSANAALPPGARPDNDNLAEAEKLLPPIVELRVVDQSKLPVVKFTVTARAGTKEQPLTSLKLLVDGRPFHDPKATASFDKGVSKDQREWTVELPPGKHQVVVLARSADASSLSNELEVDCRPAKDKPVMHVLAIGIDKYQANNLNLSCAVADANLITATFQQQCKGPLFEDVKTHLLTNEKATAKAVRDAITGLRSDPKNKLKAGDLVVVFFAGHGAKEKDKFYLLTHEAEIGNLAGTALSGATLRDELKEFPCQVLLIMDACQSGAFGEKGALAGAGLRPATDEATRSFTADEVGVTVFCAAMGYEKAAEGMGNGLFTKWLAKAMTETKDVPHRRDDLRQYINHVETYVQDNVARESGNKQHPFLHRPWTVEPFAVRQLAEKR